MALVKAFPEEKLHCPGEVINGKVLRPAQFLTLAVADVPTGVDAVAIKVIPMDGDENFKEPIYVMIPLERVQVLIHLLQVGEDLLKYLPVGRS